MLFRPNFCANCGVKVERPEWRPWTSSRFCMVCEIEFKGHEILPRVAAVLVLVFGVFGVGSYLSSGTKQSEFKALRQPTRTVSPPSATMQAVPETDKTSASRTSEPVGSGQPEPRALSSTYGISQSPTPAKLPVEREETVYYCNAETKKGTPCSRRVKSKTRCFQHMGMPSMALAGGTDMREQKVESRPNK